MKIICIGLLLALAAALIGPKPVKQLYNQTVYNGTVQGVSACMDLAAMAILSQETIRNACTQKFQKPVFEYREVSGRASPKTRRDEVIFSGSIENDSSDKVLSWIKVEYIYYDEEGKQATYLGSAIVWVEPSSNEDFEIVLDNFDAKDFNDSASCDADEKSDCWAWGLVGAAGLELN